MLNALLKSVDRQYLQLFSSSAEWVTLLQEKDQVGQAVPAFFNPVLSGPGFPAKLYDGT